MDRSEPSMNIAGNIALKRAETVPSLEASPRTNAFGRAFSAQGPNIVCRHPVAWIELKDHGTKWYPELRKSYKSLINWGERNLKIKIITHENFNHDDCDLLRTFHLRIANRVTRNVASWLIQYREVKEGRGEIIFGYLDDKLVAGSLFIDGTTICIYWTGVYERERFDKPLAHYPVWLGMQRAKQRGKRWLELGEAPAWGEGITEKELSLSQFKRGFATHILSPGEIPT